MKRMVSKREMWQLTCNGCGQLFLHDRKKYYRIRKGWRTWYFCSKECFATKNTTREHHPPTPFQSEADRQKAIAEIITDLRGKKL